MEVDLGALRGAGRMIAAIGEVAGNQIDKDYPDSGDAIGAHAGFASSAAMDSCVRSWHTRCHDEVGAIVTAGQNVVTAADNYVTADGNAAARFMYGSGR